MATKKHEDTIIALTQKQHLAKRMALTFGREMGDKDSPFSTQKSVSIREIVDNAIDAIRKNFNGKGNIRITFNEDYSIECYDSGGGIPTSISTTAEGRPASQVFLALGVMNAGSNYENVTDSLGTNGVGGAGAQLMSEYTTVDIYRDKKHYRLRFIDGEPVEFDKKGNYKKLEDLTKLEIEKDSRPADEKKTFPSGTKITLKLNNKLYKSIYPYNVDDIIERLKGVSSLIDGLNIQVINHLHKQENGEPTIYGIKGIVDLNSTNRLTDIHEIVKTGQLIDTTVNIGKDGQPKTEEIKKDIKVEASFTYSNNYDYYVDSYVNTIKTRLHGFHVLAFEKAMVAVFNQKLRSMRTGLNAKDIDPIYQDYAEGLSLVISVNIPEPEFTNQVKEELGGKRALKEFTKLFTSALEDWINDRKNAKDLQTIADKVVTAVRTRQKAKEAQDLKREKAKLERTTSMPVKLVDCNITHDENSEFYIVEGDSALGALKAARDSDFQALFPIRGKIKNVLKSSMKDALNNQEVQDIIKCLDAGIGKDFDITRSRYGRVFIAADADVDGQNIACLLLVLFWVLFPGLIESGNLYRVLTPLYIFKVGKGKNQEVIYCFDNNEKNIALERLRKSGKKYEMVRAKGLGETGAEVLYETGMNPDTRIIEQIVIGDVKEAIEWLEITMGNDTTIRKEWIEANPVEIEEISS